MMQLSSTIGSFFLDIVRCMDNHLQEIIRSLVSDFKISSFFILLSLAFLYGVLHSLGPGHGKSLIASFFLKEKHPLQKSLILSGIVSIVHTGSAIILSFLFYFVLTSIRGMFRIKMQSYFMIVSGLFVMVIGILFLFLKIFHKKKDHEEGEVQPTNRNLILVGVSAGIVPCPASMMIMLFTMSKGIAFIGLMAVLSISIGMFFLLTLVGLISIKSRDGIMALSGKMTNRTEVIATVVEYVSIVLIILIGFGMASKILLNMFG